MIKKDKDDGYRAYFGRLLDQEFAAMAPRLCARYRMLSEQAEAAGLEVLARDLRRSSDHWARVAGLDGAALAKLRRAISAMTLPDPDPIGDVAGFDLVDA